MSIGYSKLTLLRNDSFYAIRCVHPLCNDGKDSYFGCTCNYCDGLGRVKLDKEVADNLDEMIDQANDLVDQITIKVKILIEKAVKDQKKSG